MGAAGSVRRVVREEVTKLREKELNREVSHLSFRIRTSRNEYPEEGKLCTTQAYHVLRMLPDLLSATLPLRQL